MIALGILCRFLKAFIFQDIEQDEGNTYGAITDHSFINHFVRLDYADEHNHPPFMFIFGKIWLFLFDGEIGIRVPGFLFSCFSLYIFYQIASILFKDRRSVLLSSTLYFATSPFFIYFGVIFRTYFLGIFLTLFFLKEYLQSIDEGEANKSSNHSVIITVSCFLALMTDYSVFWCLVPLGLFAVVDRKINTKPSKATLLGLGLFLPWVLYSLLGHFDRIIYQKGKVLPNYDSLNEFLSILSLFFNFKFLENKGVYWLTLTLCAVSAIGLYLLFKEKNKWRVFISSSVLLPNFIVIVFSIFIAPLYDYKNMWIPNLFMVIAAIYALSHISYEKLKNFLFVLLNLGMLGSAIVSVLFYANTGPLQDYKNYKTSFTKDVLSYIATRSSPAFLLVPDEGEWSSTVNLYRRWAGLDDKLEVMTYPDSRIKVSDCFRPTFLLNLDVTEKNLLEQKMIVERLKGRLRIHRNDSKTVLFSECEFLPHE